MPREMVSTTPEAADGQTVPGPSVPGPSVTGPNRVIHGDNLAVIATLPDATSVSLTIPRTPPK